MIQRLPPYFANVRKRLVKRPKLYITDSGILHWLAGLRASGDLESWAGRGASFEGLVIGELMAQAMLHCSAPRFFFFRTHGGAEVDLIVEDGARRIPIEVKLSAGAGGHDLAGLRNCMADLGLSVGYVVTRSESVRDLGHGIIGLPWEGVVRGETLPWAAKA